MPFDENQLNSVAIIGMSGRFPGADDVSEFWKNIAAGINSITDISDEELLKKGIKSDQINNNYVKKTSRLNNVSGFDAEFFSMLPSETELTDPQHRLLLECAYEAIETAGYNPFNINAQVGVYAGVGISDYLLANVALRPEFIGGADGLQALTGNDKSYACTRISHKLGLRGPSVSIDSACSTSLVAVHHACKALLLYECDYALAGGAKVTVPHGCGYQFQAGGIMSPDGACRPFDAKAVGTIQGSGVGMVFLRRLTDAIDKNDNILAVIRGSAVNNDGNHKIGYTAPSISGQAQVISQALSVANVKTETVNYVEAHGTGTTLGDPIEIKALSLAFNEQNVKTRQYCAIGSLKANIGHLDVAAGVASLIKTTLALKNKQLPPSINYYKSNPEIDFLSSPFYVNTELKDWPTTGEPRRAGVSSFGIGGTNAHMILEQAPAHKHNRSSDLMPFYAVCLSARNGLALSTMRLNLFNAVNSEPCELPDIAFTLNVGRPALEHRESYIVKNNDELIKALESNKNKTSNIACEQKFDLNTVFMFTGQGSQYTGMCRYLYQFQPIYKKCLNEIEQLMLPYLKCSIVDIIFKPENENKLSQTEYTQPALFAVEYSLATLWRCMGVIPDYVIGHSVGEIAAACFSGMFSLSDGVKLICLRAKLMKKYAKAGGMLAVFESKDSILPHLHKFSENLSIAAINAPKHVVISGPNAQISKLAKVLKDNCIANMKLQVSHAFHSSMMDGVIPEFERAINDIKFHIPTIPIVSNLKPDISINEHCSSSYWARHIRNTVYFQQGVEWLIDNGANTFIEIGPGATLSNLAKACVKDNHYNWVCSSNRELNDYYSFLSALSDFFCLGGTVDWQAMYKLENHRRINLPTYPFQRKSFWSLPDSESTFTVKPVNNFQEHKLDIVRTSNSNQSEAIGNLENTIASIWGDLLGMDNIGSQDDFFKLGGHSLLIVQLNEKIEQYFSIKLPVNTLIENSTLQEFALALKHRLTVVEPCTQARKVIEADSNNWYEPFPLVELQKAFLLGRSSEFGLGGVSSHLYFELKPNNFNYDRFVLAFNRLIKRHAMLRAVVEDNLQQRILEEVPDYNIKHYDYALNPDGLLRHLQSIRDEMSHQLMPVDQWPLYDVRVTRVSNSKSIIHFSLDLLMLDVRSNQILFRDLDNLYLGKEDLLPHLNITYRDYVIAKQTMKHGKGYEKSRKYWLNRIESFPLAPDLPISRSPDDISEPKFKRRLNVLDQKLSHRLRKKAQGLGITPSVLLMTAYGMVINYWSNRSSFTLNLTMFDRTPLHPDVNELLGDFTTVSLLAMDFSEKKSIKQRARQIQKQLWSDTEHKQFDGIDVLRELNRHYGSEQHISMPIVFTSALPLEDNYNSDLPDDSLLAGIDDAFSISQTPQVWIDHVVSEDNGQIVLSWDAIDDLFPDRMLDDMFDAYIALVNKLVTVDELWLKDSVDLLPDNQKLLRNTINKKTFTDNSYANLMELFITRAKSQANSIAVINSDITLTYQQLYDYACFWARYLNDQGITQNDLVAIVMKKGWQQIVAAYAIQLAGAAYIPVDALLPEERQLQILKLSKCRLAFTQSDHYEHLNWPDEISVAIITEKTLPLKTKFIPPNISPENLAYVLFTSGSTGTPKGVVIDHIGSSNTMLDAIERFGITANDTALAVSSMSFDMSVFDVFGMLIAGGSIVIPSADEVRDPKALADLIHKHNITLINTVPAMVQIIVDYYEVLTAKFPDSMRLIMMGGDFIPVTLPDRIWALSPNILVHSLGGPTETAIYSVEYPIKSVEPHWISIPYGKPMRNRSCYIFDEQLKDKPDWVSGEIYIGRNEFIAKGYWEDEARTHELFVKHPVNGEVLFKTGDLGRYLNDGNIEILGRKDFQVKVNGFRVELGEIESLLLSQNNISKAVASLKSLSDKRKCVVAYIVFNSNEDLTKSDIEQSIDFLKQLCIDRLPDYMVPQYFVPLSELPLTENGKVHRSKLPMPDIKAVVKQENHTPRNDLDKLLLGIWQTLLENNDININDNFFQLGGHSVIAAQMVTRIHNYLNLDIPIRLIFNFPTIFELSDQIRMLQGGKSMLPQLQPVSADEELLLSYAQQRLWFVDQYEKSVPGYAMAYNMPIVWSLTGKLDAQALRKSCQMLIDRHSILRTAIVAEKGKPRQLIHSAIELPWLEVDAARSQLEKLLEEQIAKPFDLAKPPLMRCYLYRWDRDEYIFLINTHHIVTDAWSVAIISRELQTIYNSITAGVPPDLNPDIFQYVDYAHWQRKTWDEGHMQSHEDYWLDRLQDLPDPINIIKNQLFKDNTSYFARAVTFEIEPEISRLLNMTVKQHGLTPFMVLLANFNILLHLYSGEQDIIIGTDTANRQILGSEEILGYFINQLAIRSKVDKKLSVNDYITQLRDCVLEAFEHEAMPLDRLVDKLQLSRDINSTPIFQVKLNYHSLQDEPLSFNDLKVEPQAINYSTVHYNIVLTFKSVEDKILATLQYKSELFSEPSMQALVRHYLHLLSELLNKPDKPIAALNYLPQTELKRLVKLGQAKNTAQSKATLSQRFTEQARKYPERIAVRYDDRELSYQHLEHLSNQLAHYLITKNIKPGDFVGLYLERGVNQIIAILGTLKAGAAYVPLDVHSPEERILLILDDANVNLIISDQNSLQENPLSVSEIKKADIKLLDKQSLAEYSDSPIDALYDNSTIAYVIYTSGTTGRPKGVMVSHKNVCRLIDSCQGFYQFNEHDVWSMFHSYVFDFSVWEMWGAFLHGGRLLLVPYWLTRSGEKMWSFIRKEGVTVLNQTPSAFKAISDFAISNLNQYFDELKLRYIIFGGEALEFQNLSDWFNCYGDSQPLLVNMYGITETTIHTTFKAIKKSDLKRNKSIIGIPIQDLDIYILDQNLCPVPEDIAGEIYVGGEGLSSGYFHRAGLTADRFIPNHFRDDGSRLYKSGDLAKWSWRGEIEYIGRIDQQVKIRGYRIEMGEIENCLMKHPSVKEVILCSGYDKQKNVILIAYWQPRSNQSTDNRELRAWVKRRLPEYMVPALFFEVKKFPLTINGKIDRKALPKPTLDEMDNQECVAPTTVTEEVVLKLVSELLQVSNIGVNHNFFEIGGHSLLATQFVALLQDEFLIELDLRAIFESSTIAELARYIDSTKLSKLAVDIISNKVDSNENKEEFVI